MKNDTNTYRLLNAKIDALDTLSVGVVYSKDDAWEKLQSRMDIRRTQKIRLKYAMSIAASLLAFACFMVIYPRHPLEITINKEFEKIKEPVYNNEMANAQYIQNVAPTPQKTIHWAARNTAYNVATRTINENKLPVIASMQQSLHPIEEEIKKEQNLVINTPAPPLKKTMKVLHINEVDEEPVANNAPPTLSPHYGLSINKMPVVHINQLNQNENEINNLEPLPRKDFFVVAIPFLNPPGNTFLSTNTEETYTHQYQLKINSN